MAGSRWPWHATLLVLLAGGGVLLVPRPALLWAQAEPPLRSGEAYELARRRLLAQGWRLSRRRGDDACSVTLPDDRRCALFPELASCAATGLGLCRFEWVSPAGQAFAVITRDGSPAGGAGRIESWFRLE
jgi:hypothetical protein